MKNYFPFFLFLFAITTLLCHAQNPTLWGMTYQGGQQNYGMIFNYNATTDIETDIHDFGSDTDGKYCTVSLIRANNGLLYGLTPLGGANNAGIIFSYNISTGNYTDLHDFGSGTDGVAPRGLLIQVSDSLLYGITQDGGTNGMPSGDGIIFS
jgi:uncharacterized repeat protein (TIGR03803 family)